MFWNTLLSHNNIILVYGGQEYDGSIRTSAFLTRKCIVLYKEEGPMCSLIGDSHLIFLAVRDNYWCQWVYQFAHEYCHHLINGPLSGEWSKMLWFEETICELSSLYNLYMMKSFCLNNGIAFHEELADTVFYFEQVVLTIVAKCPF